MIKFLYRALNAAVLPLGLVLAPVYLINLGSWQHHFSIERSPECFYLSEVQVSHNSSFQIKTIQTQI